MTNEELLQVFDREQRREVEFPNIQREATPYVVRHVPKPGTVGDGFVIWSRLDEKSVDAAIDGELAYFRGLGRDFEWKVYDYDTPPDLRERLAARGFEIEAPEAVMVLDLDEAPEALWHEAAHELIQLTDPSQLGAIIDIKEAVWGEKSPDMTEQLAGEMRADPSRISFYLAYADGAPVSCAWIRFHPGTHFASLWGGSTLPAYRKHGLYTAVLAVRAQEARRRGYRFLTIDASPMSRPIVEKHGFRFLTHAHACKWHVRT